MPPSAGSPTRPAPSSACRWVPPPVPASGWLGQFLSCSSYLPLPPPTLGLVLATSKGRMPLSSYLVIKGGLISSRFPLPVTGLCFYEGSLFLWKAKSSPKVHGGDSRCLLCTAVAPCQLRSAAARHPWEPEWVGIGAEARSGQEAVAILRGSGQGGHQGGLQEGGF